jgi:hypothetical protein
MNLTSYVVILLLLIASILTWLVRGNRIFLICCIFLAPLPAVAVMVLFAERFSFEPEGTDILRVAVALLVCYAIVWMSLLAGWLSHRINGR